MASGSGMGCPTSNLTYQRQTVGPRLALYNENKSALSSQINFYQIRPLHKSDSFSTSKNNTVQNLSLPISCSQVFTVFFRESRLGRVSSFSIELYIPLKPPPNYQLCNMPPSRRIIPWLDKCLGSPQFISHLGHSERGTALLRRLSNHGA